MDGDVIVLNTTDGQKAYNAREGIETFPHLVEVIDLYLVRKHTMLERALRRHAAIAASASTVVSQKAYNAREGIETTSS